MPGKPRPKPEWLKVRIPRGERYRAVRRAVNGFGLHTVCQEARCPNVGECWEAGTATFMILGDVCTRGCRFCAVTRGSPADVDEAEPARVADAVREMGIDYAVVTSVTRDDLPDGGARIFAETVRAVHALEGSPLVELLIPDLTGACLATVIDSDPEVLAHNVEVVRRLTGELRHPRFDYDTSLRTLDEARRLGARLTKSSIMLGLGETEAEIIAAMADLRSVDVRILVLGQYLRPTVQHAEVVEYVPPDRFDALAEQGRNMGFDYVAAGPLVRTSYKAAEAFVRRILS